MSRRSTNARLAALLVEAHWSGGQLARAVNATGTTLGLRLRYDRTSVAHWLAGSRPKAPVPELVAQVLSRQCGRPVTAAETGLVRLTPKRDPLAPDPDREDSAALRLATLCRRDTDPQSRPLLAQAMYTLAPVPVPDWEPPSPRPRPPSHRACPADAETLREMTHVFAFLQAAYGGGHARTALAAYLAEDVSRLLHASASDALHGELLSCAAQLTHQLASMTVESGYQGLAQRYFRTSLSLAHEAGDRATYAITLRALSGQALALGHLRQADELADAAHTTGAGEGPAVRSFLLSQRALTAARRGRQRDALAHLEAAAEAHEGTSDQDEPGPFTSYPRASLEYQAARTLLVLGRTVGALDLLRASLRHRDPAQLKQHALTHARVAESLFSLGHAESACAHGDRFLDHYPKVRSVEADEAALDLDRSLSSFPSLPVAVRVRRRAAALLRTRSHRPGRAT